MGFLKRLFGVKSAPAPVTHPPSQLHSGHSQQSVSSTASTGSARRELLRVVLRDTLNRHGIPAAWIESEMLVSTSRRREPGIHWRLRLKHWEPRLLTHGVAFQQSLIRRVMTFDPLASNWLTGISWQFAIPDETLCPPMPHPGSWTSDRPDPRPAKAALAAGGAGDLIAGPVRIAERSGADSTAAAKADLERLMAARDADFKQNSDNKDPGSEPTQPMFLATEPGRL